MKKVFVVEPEDWDYDEYDGIAVAADSSQEAIEIAENFFSEDQGKLTAEEIDMTKSGVILSSFNAG